MAWIHGMHKETKPKTIKKKKNKHVNEKQKRMIVLEREKKQFFSWNPNAKHESAYDDYYIVIKKKKKFKLTFLIIIAKIKTQSKIKVHVTK